MSNLTVRKIEINDDGVSYTKNGIRMCRRFLVSFNDLFLALKHVRKRLVMKGIRITCVTAELFLDEI
jgi:hypothetical protein